MRVQSLEEEKNSAECGTQ